MDMKIRIEMAYKRPDQCGFSLLPPGLISHGCSYVSLLGPGIKYRCPLWEAYK